MTPVSRSLLITLGSALIAWALFMVALYTDLFVSDVFDDGVRVGQDPPVAPATYLFLAAVTVFGLASLWGQRIAISLRGNCWTRVPARAGSPPVQHPGVDHRDGALGHPGH